MNNLIEGAEAALPDEGCQPQHSLRQHRLFVQNLPNLLQLCLRSCFHRQDHALAQAVARTEGNTDAATRKHMLQRFGKQIAVGLVYGIGKPIHRDFRDHGRHSHCPCG